ncbi:glutamate-5-semialdehyde dehydrogenase [Sneathiella limimaris]|uniref:glutamate-5-semialdehyde dehydrogenase n=1 Tax=Sneathiella limimaris TaxID=1964213 RepID=UPI00146D6A99|nr:glutamate-5-semialdehyde dehydrogenase [Sneathiella limimaris]
MCPSETKDIEAIMNEMGQRAKAASQQLANAPTEQKNAALKAAARSLIENTQHIMEENSKDMDAVNQRPDYKDSYKDRLKLDKDRIKAMADGLEDIAKLNDPVGEVIANLTPRNRDLTIERVRVPLGVIGIIYESRPNVTADAGALCLKSGNACILRGGSDSFHSSRAILGCLQNGLKEAGLDPNCIQLIPTTDRAAVGKLLTMTDTVDVIVPRGGRGLIERIQRESKIPVFSHLDGLVHIYLDKEADPKKALDVIWDAKLRRTGICGALETLLIHEDVAFTFAPSIIEELLKSGCEIRGDDIIQSMDERVKKATEEDWKTEYLDKILSVRVVSGLEEAMHHIETYGSHHTDCIITENDAVATQFLNEVNSAIVVRNASTQFADGGEFGMGAEIGISTGKMHARGPVGVEQLTTFKYKVIGDGTTRGIPHSKK